MGDFSHIDNFYQGIRTLVVGCQWERGARITKSGGKSCGEEFKYKMAVLEKLPEQAIIDGFKGKIDFYLWKGIPCARKWPVWHAREPTPLERSGQEDFAYANKAFIKLPEYIQSQYRRMAASTPFSAKDLFIRAYMSGITY